MITKLEIDNFRGHKHLEMDGISPITLVTGTNNVGKSSVLEALYLFNDHSSPGVFSTMAGLRGALTESVVKSWEVLFHRMNVEEGLKLSIEMDKKDHASLLYKKSSDYAPLVQSKADGFIPGSNPTGAKLPYLLEYTYKHGEYGERGVFDINGNGLFVNIETTLQQNEREKMPFTILVTPMVPRMAYELMEWVGGMEISGKKDLSLEVLKLIDPDIIDIFSATQNGQAQLYIKKKSNGVLPLKYAGDGLVRLFYIMTAIMSNTYSLVLIDEIENGFHYSMYEKIWESLSKAAKNSSCQIIATTHSYENIEACVRGVDKADRKDDFSVHRLDYGADFTRDHRYDFEMAEMAVRSKLEVR